ncbi:hypothetical protein LRS04_15030 [Phenylobacterium sp. J367]|nr:hypothetical protein [Phenylobacterium sp. J367]MCR5879493.1 hypothetical protein [Phenylobacterium sp. J367]
MGEGHGGRRPADDAQGLELAKAFVGRFGREAGARREVGGVGAVAEQGERLGQRLGPGPGLGDAPGQPVGDRAGQGLGGAGAAELPAVPVTGERSGGLQDGERIQQFERQGGLEAEEVQHLGGGAGVVVQFTRDQRLASARVESFQADMERPHRRRPHEGLVGALGGQHDKLRRRLQQPLHEARGLRSPAAPVVEQQHHRSAKAGQPAADRHQGLAQALGRSGDADVGRGFRPRPGKLAEHAGAETREGFGGIAQALGQGLQGRFRIEQALQRRRQRVLHRRGQRGDPEGVARREASGPGEGRVRSRDRCGGERRLADPRRPGDDDQPGAPVGEAAADRRELRRPAAERSVRRRRRRRIHDRRRSPASGQG